VGIRSIKNIGAKAIRIIFIFRLHPFWESHDLTSLGEEYWGLFNTALLKRDEKAAAPS
jgi:hypothetical protein